MSEQIELYNKVGNDFFLYKDMDRQEFRRIARAMFENKSLSPYYIRTVSSLLLRSTGEITIQRRGPDKEDNPGLYDKSIGGHCKSGVAEKQTFIDESDEELKIPVLCCVSETEFINSLKTLDLKLTAVVKQVDFQKPIESLRILKEGGLLYEKQLNTFYLGYYDGEIKPDGTEVLEYKHMFSNELFDKIREKPTEYTHDLYTLARRFNNFLIPLEDLVKRKI